MNSITPAVVKPVSSVTKEVLSSEDRLALTPKQVIEVLARLVPAKETVMLVGIPGIGKTDLEKLAIEKAGRKRIVIHAVTYDAVDLRGLPTTSVNEATNKKFAEFLPYGVLNELINATEPTTAVFEDIHNADEFVQAAITQILWARRIGDHKISDQVGFLLTANRRSDKAGFRAMLETLKSRCTTIISMKANLDDSRHWFLENLPGDTGMYISGFLSSNPDSLCDFKPTTDVTNSACPRTWAAVGRMLHIGLPVDTEFQVIAGAIGEGHSLVFCEWFSKLKNEKSLDVDNILKFPATAPIPDNPSFLYAITMGLAKRTDKSNISSVIIYLQRLSDAKKNEFFTLLLSMLSTEMKCHIFKIPEWDTLSKIPAFKAIMASYGK